MKKTNIIILIVSILLFLGTGSLLIKPMMAEIDNYKKQKEISDSTIVNLKSVKKTLIDQNKLQENADLLRIRETLPNDPGIPDLLIQIQALSSNTGVAMSNFSFQSLDGGNKSLLSASDASLSGDIAKGDFSTIKISMGITGVYSSIKSFIKAVENNLRIMDITSLKLTGPKSNDSLEMSADLEITAYYKSAEKNE